jgi:hypothetical protein
LFETDFSKQLAPKTNGFGQRIVERNGNQAASAAMSSTIRTSI